MPLEKQEENVSGGMAIHIGVDIGGTFTDLAAHRPWTGRSRYTKALITHARPLDGIMACVDKVGIDLGEAVLFRHDKALGKVRCED